MTQDTTTKGPLEQHTALELADHIRLVAGRMREFADQLAGIAADVDLVGQEGRDSYAAVAARAQQLLISTMWPNLGLHTLTKLAREADYAQQLGL